MGNQPPSSNSFLLQDIEKQIDLLIELPDTKLMPNFSLLLIEEKLKYFTLIYDNIKAQKANFLANCGKIKDSIDELFHCVVNLLSARQKALKHELLIEAREKVAIWDHQLATCEAILKWLTLMDVTNNKINPNIIRNVLNSKLTKDFEFIDSGDIQFDIGEETINTSTITLLKPLENLGKIVYSRDLRPIAPKFIIGGSGDKAGQFCRPWGACTDSTGYIFVSDRSNHRIQIFNELGEFTFQFGKEGSQPGEFNRPAGITVNKKNQIIVCDKDNHRIQIFTYSGRLLTKFGSQGVEAGEFHYPWDVAVNSKYEIAVSDSKNHRVQLFNEFGDFLKLFDWRSMGINRPRTWTRFLDSPRGLAFRPNDSLLVTDFNNHKIFIIHKNFDRFCTLGCEGKEPGKFFRPQGITCDEFGRFAVADCKNYRVQVFDAKNRPIKVFGSKGTSPGQFDCPQGISFHPNGSIVVVDFNNDRVQVF